MAGLQRIGTMVLLDFTGVARCFLRCVLLIRGWHVPGVGMSVSASWLLCELFSPSLVRCVVLSGVWCVASGTIGGGQNGA